jgi:hypothetical protein
MQSVTRCDPASDSATLAPTASTGKCRFIGFGTSYYLQIREVHAVASP